jgi:hypothetical protein
MSIDMHDNDSGFTTSALPGKTSDETRKLFILATCATKFTNATKNSDPNANRLDRFSHAFNFPELRKPTRTSPMCTTICNIPFGRLYPYCCQIAANFLCQNLHAYHLLIH